jgi:hypothetical protein
MAALVDDVARAAFALAALGGNAQFELDVVEAHPGAGLAGDLAIGNSAADTDDHGAVGRWGGDGFSINENLSHSQAVWRARGIRLQQVARQVARSATPDSAIAASSSSRRMRRTWATPSASALASPQAMGRPTRTADAPSASAFQHVRASPDAAIDQQGKCSTGRLGDPGQRLRRGRRAIQGAAAVVRDHDARGADGLGTPGVGGCSTPLIHKGRRVWPRQPFHVGPAGRLRQQAASEPSTCRRPVPGWLRRCRRQAEAGPALAVSHAVDGRVDGHHEGLVAGGFRAPDQLERAGRSAGSTAGTRVARALRRPARRRCDGLQRHVGQGAQHEAGLLGRCGDGGRHFAIGMQQALVGERRDQDGMGERDAPNRTWVLRPARGASTRGHRRRSFQPARLARRVMPSPATLSR